MSDYRVGDDGKLYRRIELYSGGVYPLPAGVIEIDDMGPFMQLQKWSPERQLFLPSRSISHGNGFTLLSTGNNYRLANTMNCAASAAVTAGGSGYTKGDPPILSSNAAPAQGLKKPTFRAIVGGGVHVAGTGGLYDYPPTLVWDYTGQVAPFRPIQIAPLLNGSGQVTGWHHDGNSQAGALGATGSTAYSGAGINLAILPPPTIVRHPNDTQTSNVTVTVSEQGADQVTAIDVTDHGCAIGNVRYEGQQLTTDHKGGSGLTWTIRGNLYVTGITISDGGSYTDMSDVALVPTDDQKIAIIAMAGGDDEVSRPAIQIGHGNITAGAITSVSFSGIGPGFQSKVRIATALPGLVKCVRPANLLAQYGAGGDYTDIRWTPAT